MKIIAIIPARSGSKAITDKNIANLGGKPVISYQLSIAKKALKLGLIDDIMVTTDAVKYLDVLREYDFIENYLRPKELAADDSPTVDAVKHALEYKSSLGKNFDAVLLLQPTSPFNRISDVKAAVEKLSKNCKATCVTTVTKLSDHHPFRIKFLDENDKLIDISEKFIEAEHMRRQDFRPSAYIRTGAIYLSRVSTINKQGGLRGNKMFGIKVPSLHAVNIDDPVDLITARSILSENLINFDTDCLAEFD